MEREMMKENYNYCYEDKFQIEDLEERHLYINSGIDEAVIQPPLVILLDGAFKIAVVHGFMVTDDDYRGVFVEGLGLNPVHEGCHLTA